MYTCTDLATRVPQDSSIIDTCTHIEGDLVQVRCGSDDGLLRGRRRTEETEGRVGEVRGVTLVPNPSEDFRSRLGR